MNSGNIIGLKFTESNIVHQFFNISEYYKEISLMIKSKKFQIIEVNKELQKKLKNESDETKEQYSDRYADDWYVVEMVEHTFCNSMIISIYTLIEKYINKICESLMNYKNIPITYKDLRDDGIVRAKNYIDKLCGLKFNTKDSVFLSGINAIRNVIAHENGELYNTQEKTINKIINISQQSSGCIINKTEAINDNQKEIIIYQNIELEFSFVEYCLEQGKSVFKNIFKQLT